MTDLLFRFAFRYVYAPLLLPMAAMSCSPAEGPADVASDATSVGAAATVTPAAFPPLPEVAFEPAFPGVDRDEVGFMPLLVVPAPDDRGMVAIVDQTGLISLVEDRPGATEATRLLDISDRVSTRGEEEGLLGLAFDPGWESNRRFYVYYSAADPRRSVLSRFTAGESTAASEEVLLEVEQPFSNHNGGGIVFGPDGYLYVGLGDGGSRGDPQGNGQNKETLLGSLLRIDVTGVEHGYRAPPDNPFVGEPGAREEIWAYGLRNPWRFSFDSETGELWLADVGQNRTEEIDIIEKGGNYGWNVLEGNGCFQTSECDRAGLIGPVFEYGRSDGCSITGGYVYRGSAIPGLAGAYLYSDFCSGRVWALRHVDGEVVQQREIGRGLDFVSSFGAGHDGELFVATFGGGVMRVVSSP